MRLKRSVLERRVRRMRLRAKGEASAPHVNALVAALSAVRRNAPPVSASPLENRPAGEKDWRRGDRRLPFSAEVPVRKAGGFNFQLHAFDVSQGGCRVELVEAVDTCERVIVRLPSLEPLGADVAWVSGNQAGLRFERPLHPAVFDHLMAKICAA